MNGGGREVISTKVNLELSCNSTSEFSLLKNQTKCFSRCFTVKKARKVFLKGQPYIYYTNTHQKKIEGEEKLISLSYTLATHKFSLT